MRFIEPALLTAGLSGFAVCVIWMMFAALGRKGDAIERALPAYLAAICCLGVALLGVAIPALAAEWSRALG